MAEDTGFSSLETGTKEKTLQAEKLTEDNSTTIIETGRPSILER